ncbi:glycosyltransferase family 9 protein [Maribacter algicola]|uniref:Glycosyltransferase family 9 protein n=1 Tax=Meishania litoralis TaxID=3434685 RepID=A0ACC7LH87_9FLAO
MASSERRSKHILVIRLSAMGDVAMMVPVLKALQDQHPHVNITVLTKQHFHALFSQLNNVKVNVADVKGKHKGPLGLWKLYKELRSLDIDAVADLHDVLRSNILVRYFRVGGVPFYQIDKGRKAKKKLTAAKNKVFKPLKTTHERYADVFKRMGFPVDLSQAPLLEKEKLTNRILALVGRSSKKWLGIAPFAAHTGKMYPLDLMEKVIGDLNATSDCQILLFGGGEKEIGQLDKLDGKFANCLNIAGKLTFQEELALISNLDLMISMDSGNGHLAAMYGIPVITLWGVTHPYAGFYPFGQDINNALLADREQFPLIPTSIYGNKMPLGYELAIETIRPAEIIGKAQEILGSS